MLTFVWKKTDQQINECMAVCTDLSCCQYYEEVGGEEQGKDLCGVAYFEGFCEVYESYSTGNMYEGYKESVFGDMMSGMG